MGDSMKQYDVVVIGSGSGGEIVDASLSRGFSVAWIDKGPLGGTCLNVGCIPSKMLIYPADRIVEIINNMFEDKPSLIRTFKIGGVEYGIIPDLDEMSLGEYIDLDTYIGDWQNMQIAMNVLYRPISKKIGDKYLINEYTLDAKEKLEEIPMDIVLGSIFFLYNLGIDLSKTMVDYLEAPQMDSLMQEQIFQESMDGIKASSLHSLKTILEDLKISLN